MTSEINPSFVWNRCKILKNCWINVKPPNVRENLQNNSDKETALNKLCPLWVQTDPDFIPEYMQNEFLDHLFDFFEFNVALESKRDNSALGMDGIGFEVIKKLSMRYKLILLDIFNEMYLV